MKVSACLKLTHPHGLTFCYDDIMLETATTFVFRDPKTSSDFKASRGPKRSSIPREQLGKMACTLA